MGGWIVCMVGLGIVLGTACVGGLIVLVYYLSASSSERSLSLRDLVARYPARSKPEGPVMIDETIQLGMAHWRHCTHISIEPDGLYMAVRPALYPFEPMLIPWEALEPLGETRLFYQRAHRLAIGQEQAQLTVMDHIYQRMRVHLATEGGPADAPKVDGPALSN